MQPPTPQEAELRHASTIRALTVALALSIVLPLLAACNTTAGAGQDVSAAGRAVTRSANEVKSGL